MGYDWINSETKVAAKELRKAGFKVEAIFGDDGGVHLQVFVESDYASELFASERDRLSEMGLHFVYEVKRQNPPK